MIDVPRQTSCQMLEDSIERAAAVLVGFEPAAIKALEENSHRLMHIESLALTRTEIRALGPKCETLKRLLELSWSNLSTLRRSLSRRGGEITYTLPRRDHPWQH